MTWIEAGLDEARVDAKEPIPLRRQPRILIVSTTAITIRSFLLPFVRHFRAMGWKVDGAARGLVLDHDAASMFDATFDIEWSRSVLDFRNLTVAARKVGRLVGAGEYDIVHLHTPIAAFVTRFALRRLHNRPYVIYTAHGFHFFRGARGISPRIFRMLEQLGARWTDTIVTINREDYESAKAFQSSKSLSVEYCPGIGVDTASLVRTAIDHTVPNAVRASLSLTDEPLFLMVAEFNPGKRHRDAVSALARMNDPNAHLAFAGVGPTEEDVKALAKSLGVDSRVHFLGYRRDIPHLMVAATALILPSEREGLPRSVLEAMCLELPVIGADTRGIRDLLADNCGLLHPVGDTERLADCMRRIANNRDLHASVATNGRRAVGTYDISKIVGFHEALYQDALGRSSRRSDNNEQSQ